MRRGVELVGRRRPVILGISSPSIRTSIELAH
jgi:dihydrodipicolinate synthase/N-acetylneuraminate lyase